MDEQRVAAALMACMNLYGKQTSTDVLDLYVRALSRYSTDDILRALEVHLLDPDVGQFAPKPADIVRRIQGSNTTAGARAWARVADAVRSVGSWRTVVFDDPLIHACIDAMGGWIKLCAMKEDEQPFRAKDFERLYIGYKQQGATPAYPKKLIGRAEAQNALDGRELDRPVMIGDASRAMLVYNAGGDKPTRVQELLPSLVL